MLHLKNDKNCNTLNPLEVVAVKNTTFEIEFIAPPPPGKTTNDILTLQQRGWLILAATEEISEDQPLYGC